MRKTIAPWARRIGILALLIALCLSLSGCVNQYAEQVAEQMAQQEAEDAEPRATLGPMTAEMFTDRQAVYQYYNQVKVGDTLQTLTERFGEPTVETTENGETYLWVMDDGYGVACVFFETGKLRAKIVYYDDPRQFAQLSNANGIGNMTQLNRNYTFEMACGLLGGRAMELMQLPQDISADPEVKRVFLWVDQKGNMVQILFSGDERLESVTYTMAEEE